MNFEYGKDESKNFYIIKTPIKYFDDYKFTEELKRKIFLIDLPGFDTDNNKFNAHDKVERSIYEKLLEICSSFVFINRGRAITDIKNKTLLKKVYNIIYDNSSLNINNCLFVINMDEKLSDDNKKMEKIQEDFSSIIFNNIEEQQNNTKNINAALFDAKSYMEYLDENNKINIENLFNKFKNDFKNKKGKKNFTKFCLTSLKSKCQDLSMKFNKNFESDYSFYKEIENKMLSIKNELNINYDESDILNFKTISNILQYITNKIKENKFYIDSNCENFFITLTGQINKAKTHVEQNFNDNLDKCFSYFDMIFKKDISPENSNELINLRNKTDTLINELKELESKYEIEKIFDKYYNEIDNLFQKIENDKKILISKYEKDIEKLIKSELEEKIIRILNKDLDNEIDSTMENLDKELEKKKNEVYIILNEGLKNEIKKGYYKIHLKKIVNFSFLEKMKLKIYDILRSKKKTAIIASIGSFAIFFAISTLTFNIIGIISSLTTLLIAGLSSFLINKYRSKEQVLLKKLEECKKEFNDNFLRIRIKFIRLYKDSLSETKKLFRELLILASADLSKIEKKKWNELKEKYKKVKNNILSYLINNN